MTYNDECLKQAEAEYILQHYNVDVMSEAEETIKLPYGVLLNTEFTIINLFGILNYKNNCRIFMLINDKFYFFVYDYLGHNSNDTLVELYPCGFVVSNMIRNSLLMGLQNVFDN
ncbi:MAG: hypothetical protein KC414_04820, partial [Romboutsia sp.]|nr:hypothetical protein [Romboutsia sp.]